MQRFQVWLWGMAVAASAASCVSLDTLDKKQIEEGLGGQTGDATIRCADGQEVAGTFCDDQDDCDDASDETSCGSAFDCGNGNVVPGEFVCDTFNDCGNNHDEKESLCVLARYTCSDDTSVLIGDLCDGNSDCTGGEDEMLCTVPGIICADRTDFVETRQLCDGKAQCPDKSDEDGCPSDSKKAMLCSDGRTVVPRNKFCNGTPDCGDGADEMLCEMAFGCGPNELRHPSVVCNGTKDCVDPMSMRDDEANCVSGQYQCPGILPVLPIDPAKVCDGNRDCGSMMAPDEAGCVMGYRCKGSSLMLPPGRLCDGVEDCDKGDDEALCFAPVFECGDGTPLPAELVCDRQQDCADGSDEADDRCFPLFECATGDERVRRIWVCDGFKDCKDGSDESDACELAQFICDDGSTVQNLDVCDGNEDCDDGSDETSCPLAFECSGSSLPVPVSSVCDGTDDCDDGSDESLCIQ